MNSQSIQTDHAASEQNQVPVISPVQSSKKWPGYRIVMLFAIALWCIALVLPAYIRVDNGAVQVIGHSALLQGMLFDAMLVGLSSPYGVAWLANIPFFIMSMLVVFGKYRKQVIGKGKFIASCVVLAVSVLALIPNSVLGESENDAVSVYAGTAAYLWVLANLICLAAIIVARPRPTTTP